jgi:hypothetical protein
MLRRLAGLGLHAARAGPGLARLAGLGLLAGLGRLGLLAGLLAGRRHLGQKRGLGGDADHRQGQQGAKDQCTDKALHSNLNLLHQMVDTMPFPTDTAMWKKIQPVCENCQSRDRDAGRG